MEKLQNDTQHIMHDEKEQKKDGGLLHVEEKKSKRDLEERRNEEAAVEFKLENAKDILISLTKGFSSVLKNVQFVDFSTPMTIVDTIHYPGMDIQVREALDIGYEIVKVPHLDQFFLKELKGNDFDFSDFHELIVAFWDYYMLKLKENFFILQKPHRVYFFDSPLIFDPVKLGFNPNVTLSDYEPWRAIAEYAKLNVGLEAPLLNNLNDLRVMTCICDKMRKHCFNVVKEYLESNDWRGNIHLIEDYINQFSFASLKKFDGFHIDGMNDRILPVENPNGAFEVLNDLPDEPSIRLMLIMEVLAPSFKMQERSSTADAKRIEVKITQQSPMTDLLTVPYEADMEDEIAAILSCFFAPGYLNISVDFSDYVDQPQSRAYAAMLCKMLFIYNERVPESTIDFESVKNIDSYICQLARDIRAIDEFGDRAIYDYRTHFWSDETVMNRLSSTNNRNQYTGNGWLSNGRSVREEFPARRHCALYPQCEPYPRYLGIDTNTELFKEQEGIYLQRFQVYSAFRTMFNARNVRKEWYKFFLLLEIFGQNYIKFLHYVNRYVERNYFSAFRASVVTMMGPNGYYSYGRNAPIGSLEKRIPVVVVRARTIVYFARALPNEEFIRKHDIWTQFKAELSLRDDYERFIMPYFAIGRTIGYFRLGNYFKDKDVLKLALERMRDGYFKKILMSLKQQDRLRRVFVPRLQIVQGNYPHFQNFGMPGPIDRMFLDRLSTLNRLILSEFDIINFSPEVFQYTPYFYVYQLFIDSPVTLNAIANEGRVIHDNLARIIDNTRVIPGVALNWPLVEKNLVMLGEARIHGRFLLDFLSEVNFRRVVRVHIPVTIEYDIHEGISFGEFPLSIVEIDWTKQRLPAYIDLFSIKKLKLEYWFIEKKFRQTTDERISKIDIKWASCADVENFLYDVTFGQTTYFESRLAHIPACREGFKFWNYFRDNHAPS